MPVARIKRGAPTEGRQTQVAEAGESPAVPPVVDLSLATAAETITVASYQVERYTFSEDVLACPAVLLEVSGDATRRLQLSDEGGLVIAVRRGAPRQDLEHESFEFRIRKDPELTRMVTGTDGSVDRVRAHELAYEMARREAPRRRLSRAVSVVASALGALVGVSALLYVCGEENLITRAIFNSFLSIHPDAPLVARTALIGVLSVALVASVSARLVRRHKARAVERMRIPAESILGRAVAETE